MCVDGSNKKYPICAGIEAHPIHDLAAEKRGSIDYSLARLDSLLGEASSILPMTPIHSKRRSVGNAGMRPAVSVPKINIGQGEDRKPLHMPIQTPHSRAIGSLIDEADLLLGEVEEQGHIPSSPALIAPPPSLEMA